MIKIEKTEVVGWEHAVRGMRNPKNSWDKTDSFRCSEHESCASCPMYDDYDCGAHVHEEGALIIGKNDHRLMMMLRNAGTDHRKFMRMITVYTDITAPTFWWQEFDTYKVGTVRNSCSKMHKIHVQPFSVNSFSHEGCEEIGEWAMHWLEMIALFCEALRQKFNKTQDKKYWRALIEVLPEGYNMKATIMLNYEVLANQYKSRKDHKLDEWHDYCRWIKSLPYSELITGMEQEV